MRLRAVIFDVFGTVVDWRGSLVADLTAFGRERGIEADWTALVDAWRGSYAPQMDRVRHGQIAWANIDALHREALDRLLVEHGLDHLPEADRAHINRGWHRLSPWPDSVAGLERLKEKFIIGPLSNGNVALLVNMAKHARLPWDVILSAELFRHYKPDPEAYLGACRLLDLAPSEVMLVAAHNYDLRAAADLGLRTGFIARPTEYGPNQTRDLEPEGNWDIVAGNLIDLAGDLIKRAG